MSHKSIFLDYVFLAGQLKHLIFSIMQNKYWNEKPYHTAAKAVEVLHLDIFRTEARCYQDVYGMACVFL